MGFLDKLLGREKKQEAPAASVSQPPAAEEHDHSHDHGEHDHAHDTAGEQQQTPPA